MPTPPCTLPEWGIPALHVPSTGVSNPNHQPNPERATAQGDKTSLTLTINPNFLT